MNLKIYFLNNLKNFLIPFVGKQLNRMSTRKSIIRRSTSKKSNASDKSYEDSQQDNSELIKKSVENKIDKSSKRKQKILLEYEYKPKSTKN